MFLRSNWQNSLGLLIQCFIYGCSPIHTTTQEQVKCQEKKYNVAKSRHRVVYLNW